MHKLYRLNEVMERLELSHTQAYREMSSGRLRYIQRGNHRLFEEEAIDAYIAALKETDGVDLLLSLIDDAGRIDVDKIPMSCTLADLAEAKRIVAARKQVA